MAIIIIPKIEPFFDFIPIYLMFINTCNDHGHPVGGMYSVHL